MTSGIRLRIQLGMGIQRKAQKIHKLFYLALSFPEGGLRTMGICGYGCRINKAFPPKERNTLT